jgi:hypothetical protein
MLARTIKNLKSNIQARIKFPDARLMAEYAHLVTLREPTITNVIGFVDGLSIPVQCSEAEEQ